MIQKVITFSKATSVLNLKSGEIKKYEKKNFKKNSSFRHNEKHDHAFTIRQLALVKMSNHRESKRRKITHIQVKN